MKKQLAIMAVTLTIVLAGCGQKPEISAPAAAAPSSAAPSVETASPSPSASPSETGVKQETVPSKEVTSQPSDEPSVEATPSEETEDPDAPAPLLPIGNLETDENGEVTSDPAQETAPSDSGYTEKGYEGLNIYVVSNEWSKKDKTTYVTIEVENGSKKKIDANSDLFLAITVDKAFIENSVGAGFKSAIIPPGGKAKFSMSYDIQPQEIAGFALLKDYGEDPIRAIITNPTIGGN